MRIRHSIGLASCVLLGCQSRLWNKGTWAEQPSRTEVELEASDISVLFPPAGLKTMFMDKRSAGAAHWLSALVFGVRQANLYSIESSQSEERLQRLVQRGFWPSLTGQEGGRVYLPAAELQQILDTFQPASGGSGGKLSPGPLTIRAFKSLNDEGNSEVSSGVGTPGGFELLGFDMKLPERWRIVSMRLDPCPYGHMKKKVTADSGAESPPERGVCRPEIRLVAQPVLGLTADESFAGSVLPDISVAVATKRARSINRLVFPHIPESVAHRGWYFADYAVHLFYRISEDQLTQTAQALVDLKLKYAGQCGRSMKSLAVHPCLRAAWLGAAPAQAVKRYINEDRWGLNYEFPHSLALKQAANQYAEAWSQSTFAQEIVSAYSAALTGPYKAAVFLSSSNVDPWIFRLFERDRAGAWQVKTIKALDSIDVGKPIEALGDGGDEGGDSPNSDSMSQRKVGSSEIRKALSRGEVQLVPRGANLSLEHMPRGSTQGNEARRRRLKDRFVPTDKPKLDSLDFFVRSASRRQSDEEYRLLLGEIPQDQRRGLRHIKQSGLRPMDFVQMAARLNNPHLNDEFSTSCASCHLVAIETAQLGFGWEHFPYLKESSPSQSLPFKPSEYNVSKGVFDWSPVLQVIAERTEAADVKLMKPYEYESSSSTFTPPSSEYRSVRGSLTDDGFVFNQFSIYRDTPFISFRVAFETDLALQAIRKKLKEGGGSASQSTVCSAPALRSCMSMLPHSYWLGAETIEEHCWHPEARICQVGSEGQN